MMLYTTTCMMKEVAVDLAEPNKIYAEPIYRLSKAQ